MEHDTDQNIEYDAEYYKEFRRRVKKFMNFVYRIEVNGLENVDLNEVNLFAGNHLNILDSWLLVTALDENLRFMVDKKLYRYESWEKFFRRVGTFPIDPDKRDSKAVKVAIELLKEKNSVVIFPEGKTHKYKVYVPFKKGVSGISLLGNAKLVPFGINGSYIPGARLQINFGEPIDLSEYKRNEYDQVLEEKVRELQVRKRKPKRKR